MMVLWNGFCTKNLINPWVIIISREWRKGCCEEKKEEGWRWWSSRMDFAL